MSDEEKSYKVWGSGERITIKPRDDRGRFKFEAVAFVEDASGESKDYHALGVTEDEAANRLNEYIALKRRG